jgi:hypothetical protein
MNEVFNDELDAGARCEQCGQKLRPEKNAPGAPGAAQSTARSGD